MKHGGDLTEAMARHGGGLDDWLDLSTGINPCSWPVENLCGLIWQRLPSHADEQRLRDAARTCYQLPDEVELVAASGTQALIQWLPYLAPIGAVAIVGPTYSEHALAWRYAGREAKEINDIKNVPAQARHVVIVNPNNPDGRIVDRESLAALAAILKDRGGWLVIDEAFADLDPAISAIKLCREFPIVILRSFGKFYGLAGLRLGFALGHRDIVALVSRALGPWACSGPALKIGTLALSDHVWADYMRHSLKQQADKLDAVLAHAGCEIVGGTSLFRLARCADAARLHAHLASQQIWCRSFDWADDLLRFGLPPDDTALSRLETALRDA